jgi:hypothetical protein
MQAYAIGRLITIASVMASSIAESLSGISEQTIFVGVRYPY